nr:uncharacterized protein LOC106686467 isoform X2 [Halyomorpha halys]
MSIIRFLLALANTKVIVVAEDIRDLVLKSTIFEFEQKKSTFHSIPSESNDDGCVKPVQVYSTLHLLTGKNSRNQENVDSVFEKKTHNSSNSSENKKTSHWSEATPSKLFPKSIASMSKYKPFLDPIMHHRSYRKNSVPTSKSEKELFLPIAQKDTTSSKSYKVSRTKHYTFVRKRRKKRSFAIPYTGVMLNQMLPSSLIKSTSSFGDSRMVITAHETLGDNLEFPIQDRMPNKEHKYISTESMRKIQMFKSHIAPPRMKAKCENIKQEFSDLTTQIESKYWRSSNVASKLGMAIVSQPTKNKIKRSGYIFESVIAPEYHSEKTVFVNPDISEIVVGHPSKDLDAKSLKKFKPLLPDYEYKPLQKPSKIFKEEEDFDWYQTDDLYELAVREQTTKEAKHNKNNIEENKPLTLPTLAIIHYSNSQEDVSMKENDEVKKHIIVLGVQHTPYASYNDEFTTNRELHKIGKNYMNETNMTFPPLEDLITEKLIIKSEEGPQKFDVSLWDDFMLITPDQIQKITWEKNKSWGKWEKPIKGKFSGINFKEINIQNISNTNTTNEFISDEEIRPQWLAFDDKDFKALSKFILTKKTEPMKIFTLSALPSIAAESSSNLDLSTPLKPELPSGIRLSSLTNQPIAYSQPETLSRTSFPKPRELSIARRIMEFNVTESSSSSFISPVQTLLFTRQKIPTPFYSNGTSEEELFPNEVNNSSNSELNSETSSGASLEPESTDLSLSETLPEIAYRKIKKWSMQHFEYNNRPPSPTSPFQTSLSSGMFRKAFPIKQPKLVPSKLKTSSSSSMHYTGEFELNTKRRLPRPTSLSQTLSTGRRMSTTAFPLQQPKLFPSKLKTSSSSTMYNTEELTVKRRIPISTSPSQTLILTGGRKFWTVFSRKSSPKSSKKNLSSLENYSIIYTKLEKPISTHKWNTLPVLRVTETNLNSLEPEFISETSYQKEFRGLDDNITGLHQSSTNLSQTTMSTGGRVSWKLFSDGRDRSFLSELNTSSSPDVSSALISSPMPEPHTEEIFNSFRRGSIDFSKHVERPKMSEKSSILDECFTLESKFRKNWKIKYQTALRILCRTQSPTRPSQTFSIKERKSSTSPSPTFSSKRRKISTRPSQTFSTKERKKSTSPTQTFITEKRKSSTNPSQTFITEKRKSFTSLSPTFFTEGRKSSTSTSLTFSTEEVITTTLEWKRKFHPDDSKSTSHHELSAETGGILPVILSTVSENWHIAEDDFFEILTTRQHAKEENHEVDKGGYDIEINDVAPVEKEKEKYQPRYKQRCKYRQKHKQRCKKRQKKKQSCIKLRSSVERPQAECTVLVFIGWLWFYSWWQ